MPSQALNKFRMVILFTRHTKKCATHIHCFAFCINLIFVATLVNVNDWCCPFMHRNFYKSMSNTEIGGWFAAVIIKKHCPKNTRQKEKNWIGKSGFDTINWIAGPEAKCICVRFTKNRECTAGHEKKKLEVNIAQCVDTHSVFWHNQENRSTQYEWKLRREKTFGIK